MLRLSKLSWFNCAALTLVLSCVLTLNVVPTFAQQGAHPAPAPPPTPTESKPSTDFPSAKNPWEENELLYGSSKNAVSPTIGEGNNCFLPPLTGLDHFSIEVADLQAPSKAQREQRDGCAALRSSKAIEAETHLRKAVKQWPKDLPGWVVLGQVLEAQQKFDQAYDSCSQPLSTDPHYLPAYLCMADISAHSENWNQVLQLSNRALEIDPTNVAVAYDYNAAANLHLHRLAEAEKNGLKAAEIDKSNNDPRVHFLLAQVYAAKGDRENEAAQLREYLKYASDPSDVAMVKGYLAKLETPTK
jgi:tetratricopeptide (TPR) repeat protein